jgi:hypothetical protein
MRFVVPQWKLFKKRRSEPTSHKKRKIKKHFWMLFTRQLGLDIWKGVFQLKQGV